MKLTREKVVGLLKPFTSCNGIDLDDLANLVIKHLEFMEMKMRPKWEKEVEDLTRAEAYNLVHTETCGEHYKDLFRKLIRDFADEFALNREGVGGGGGYCVPYSGGVIHTSIGRTLKKWGIE